MTFLVVDSTSVKTGQTIEIIKALSGTWPLVLICFLIILFIIYRKRITMFMSRFDKISGKVSNMEVLFETSQKTNLLEQDTKVETLNEEILIIEKREHNITERVDDIWVDLYGSIFNQDWQQAEKHYQRYLSEEKDEKEKERVMCFYIYRRYKSGIINSLAELEKISLLSVHKESKYNAHIYIGFAHYSTQNYDAAKQAFINALEFTSSEEEKCLLFLEIADCVLKTEDALLAIEYLISRIPQFKDAIKVSEIYIKISKYYDEAKMYFEKGLALEMSLKYNPNNTSLLFDTAYHFSRNEINMQMISLNHYNTARTIDSNHASVLNNLGVLYSNLNLENIGHECYKKALKAGNSLAGSNLAYKYMNAGFYNDAANILEESKTLEDVSANVWEALKLLQTKKDNEEEQNQRYLKTAEKYQLFMYEYSETFFKHYNVKVDFANKNWYLNSSPIEITRNEYHTLLKFSSEDNDYSIFCPLKSGMAFSASGKKTSGLSEDFVVQAYIDKNITALNILLYNKTDSSMKTFKITTEINSA